MSENNGGVCRQCGFDGVDEGTEMYPCSSFDGMCLICYCKEKSLERYYNGEE